MRKERIPIERVRPGDVFLNAWGDKATVMRVERRGRWYVLVTEETLKGVRPGHYLTLIRD